MNVLVVNAGSSSLKYQLFDTSAGTVVAKGLCERIGIDGAITHKQLVSGKEYSAQLPMPNHTAAMTYVVEALTNADHGCVKSMDEIEAVGHRIVHGGAYFSESMLLDKDVLAKLELCRDLAPLHTGAHIQGIEGCLAVMPNTPQVLVFDTAFHQTMPKEAYTYAIPTELIEKYAIRRYGFHGTSHRYVSGEMTKILGKVEGTKIVTCHLGNGASLSAVVDGKCFDTTMGVTPLEGIMMGTRCGNIDPAIIPYLMRKGELTTADDIDKMMNKKSGMLGVSCKTSDNQEIGKLAEAGDEKCILVEKMYSHQLTKLVGGYIAAMGGVDAIVFTGGIGENSGKYRKEVAEKLAFLGIEIDDEKNKVRGQEIDITTADSKVRVLVIPTNEELVIARDTLEIVENLKK